MYINYSDSSLTNKEISSSRMQCMQQTRQLRNVVMNYSDSSLTNKEISAMHASLQRVNKGCCHLSCMFSYEALFTTATTFLVY